MPAAAARAGGMRRRAVVMRERGVGVGVGGRKAALAMGEVAKGREDEWEVFLLSYPFPPFSQFFSVARCTKFSLFGVAPGAFAPFIFKMHC